MGFSGLSPFSIYNSGTWGFQIDPLSTSSVTILAKTRVFTWQKRCGVTISDVWRRIRLAIRTPLVKEDSFQRIKLVYISDLKLVCICCQMGFSVLSPFYLLILLRACNGSFCILLCRTNIKSPFLGFSIVFYFFRFLRFFYFFRIFWFFWWGVQGQEFWWIL